MKDIIRLRCSMAKITAINVQEKNKERCNIFIDGEFRFGLSLEIVMKRRLKVGLELSETEINEISFDGQKSEALAKGLGYVSKALKTKKQVKTYLMGKGYTEDIAYYVIDKLKEYSYINDVDYARQYIESCSKNQGKRLTEFKLMSKGIRKEDIALAYESVSVPQKDNARAVAEKYMRNKELTKENILKTCRYLVGRGYSYEEAEYAVSIFKED